MEQHQENKTDHGCWLIFLQAVCLKFLQQKTKGFMIEYSVFVSASKRYA